jgi:hypothetical protein
MLLPPKAGGRRNGGSTAGEEHGEQLPCAGSSAVESIPIFVSMFPFAGERAGGDLGRLKSGTKGVSNPSYASESATMGCSSNFGGGEPPPTLPCGVRMPGEGGAFAPSGSAHLSSSSPLQPVVGATDHGFVAPPASGAPKNGDLQRFTFWCTLQHPTGCALGVGVARCPLVSKKTSY